MMKVSQAHTASGPSTAAITVLPQSHSFQRSLPSVDKYKQLTVRKVSMPSNFTGEWHASRAWRIAKNVCTIPPAKSVKTDTPWSNICTGLNASSVLRIAWLVRHPRIVSNAKRLWFLTKKVVVTSAVEIHSIARRIRNVGHAHQSTLKVGVTSS